MNEKIAPVCGKKRDSVGMEMLSFKGGHVKKEKKKALL